MFTDEECVKSCRAEARKILVRAQARFAHGDAFVGDGFYQFMRSFDAHFESAKIEVVHAQEARTRRQRPPQFFARVDFDKRLHSELAAYCEQFTQNLVTKSRDNQEERI